MVTRGNYHSPGTLSTFIICILALILAELSLNSQGTGYDYFYRISFRDKGDQVPGNYSPGELISERAQKRRQKTGVPVIDDHDLPVSKQYINQITARGFVLHCTSRWMNTGLFKTKTQADLTILSDLRFITDIKSVKIPGGKSALADKLNFSIFQDDNTSFDRPVNMLNGTRLHNSGFRGTGILMAVTDGGFYNADIVQSLQPLMNRRGIVATYDFVEKSEFVFGYHNHGTAVLSVLAGSLEGKIAGTAPGADYLLLRSEDTESEYPAEEDFWAAAAEYADSAGADIITSSLGYYNFDNPAFNYKFSDMDGNTTFITKVADIAASKGVLVFCSAGNERDKEWQRIIAPSDGDSVMAVGAVDRNNLISSFSSAGPSADGRIKPDNAAMGVSVPVQVILNSVARSNGTSFSCPVMSGLTACLLQAVPVVKNTDIIDALHRSADRYNSPDSLYGYGLPDFAGALILLQDKFISKPEIESIAVPNPFLSNVKIQFRQVPEYLELEIYNISGRLVIRRSYSDYIGRELVINDLSDMEAGIYMVKMTTGNGTFIHKVIKISK